MSFLSPAAEILESIILIPLNESIDLTPHQNGFRKGRSKTTALQAISDHITFSLNKNKREDKTVLVATLNGQQLQSIILSANDGFLFMDTLYSKPVV